MAELLKTRQIRKRQFAAMNMHFAVFGTTHQRGDQLVRIQQTIRIERLLDSGKHIKLFAAELDTHLVYFFIAHAMFARDGTPYFDTELENIGAELFCAFDFTGYVGIEKYQRMQITIPSVKDVCAPQAISDFH